MLPLFSRDTWGARSSRAGLSWGVICLLNKSRNEGFSWRDKTGLVTDPEAVWSHMTTKPLNTALPPAKDLYGNIMCYAMVTRYDEMHSGCFKSPYGKTNKEWWQKQRSC